MGARGPRAMPTAVRILQGNRSKRALPRNEPAPPRNMPSAPPYLNSYALEEWNRLAETLHRIGTLTAVDQTLFAAYCSTVARWRQAEEALQHMSVIDHATHGAVLKTKSGNFIPNPLAGYINTLRRDVQRLAAEFLARRPELIDTSSLSSEDDPIARKYFRSPGGIAPWIFADD